MIIVQCTPKLYSNLYVCMYVYIYIYYIHIYIYIYIYSGSGPGPGAFESRNFWGLGFGV